MMRLWRVLTGHSKSERDLQRRANNLKIEALRTGAARLEAEAKATQEAAGELMRLMRKDWDK